MSSKFHAISSYQLLFLKRLYDTEKGLNIAKLQFESELAKSHILVAKLQEYISAVNNSALMGICEVKEQLAHLETIEQNAFAALRKKLDNGDLGHDFFMVKRAIQQIIIILQSILFTGKYIDIDMVWNTYLDILTSKLSPPYLPVVLKMSKFVEKKRQNEGWFSERFYERGCPMQLGVFPHSNGSVTEVLYGLRHPYDDEEWLLKNKYEVKLLNQNSKTMHHSITLKSNFKNMPQWCLVKFISHEPPIATSNYLKDDAIYFQVCQ